jgi:hypothetical protein
MSTPLPAAKAAKAASAKRDVLPPDSAVLIDARIKAGERSVQLKAIANLILHDPVLTLEFLHEANSMVYAGAPVTDVEGALSRIGVGKIVQLLAQLNPQSKVEEGVSEMIEVLRYNCRRVSIVSLIIAAAAKPALAGVARVAGLFADIGHMVALMRIGKEYVDLAKEHKRKNLAFRLQKDKHLDVNTLRSNMVGSKGMPKIFQIAFNPAEEAKGNTEVELRCVIQSAQELIDAWDGEKFGNYSPEKGLPTMSNLRVLSINNVQHQRIYIAVKEYLKSVTEKEAPEGAAFLCTTEEEDSKIVGDEKGNGIRVPIYPHTSVNARSRDKLQDFFSLCEGEKNVEQLKIRAAEYLASSGLFQRTAIIHIDEANGTAMVDFSTGANLKAGTVVPATSANSPFAALTIQIKSTRIATTEAPFGVSAYAIGPLDNYKNGDRQVLYADAQGEHILSMESRRVFRLALGLLARTVQSLQGAPTADSTTK